MKFDILDFCGSKVKYVNVEYVFLASGSDCMKRRDFGLFNIDNGQFGLFDIPTGIRKSGIYKDILTFSDFSKFLFEEGITNIVYNEEYLTLNRFLKKIKKLYE